MEEQRIFASFINDFVYIITKQWFARFLKTFLPKLSATRTLHLCRSLCLRHLRDIVFMLSPPCSPPLCVPFTCSRLTLKKGHTEKWRAQRFYIAEIVCHRGTVGAWRNRGYLQILLMIVSTSLQSSGSQDFLKLFVPKISATRTLHLCRSLCLWHLRDIVCFHLRVLPLSV